MLKEAKSRVDLAGIAGFDGSLHLLDELGSAEGVMLGDQNGQRSCGNAFKDFHGGIGRSQAAGEQNTGNIGLVVGDLGGDGSQQDVGAIAGGDDQEILFQVGKEVIHMHGGDEEIGDQHLWMFGTADEFGVERAGYVAERRAAKSLILGNGVDEGLFAIAGEAAAKPGKLCIGEVGAVDDSRDQVTVTGHGVHARVDDLSQFGQVLVLAAHHEEDGSTDVTGDIRVELEFKGRILAAEISAEAEDEVILGFEGFEFLEDAFFKGALGITVDDVVSLVFRVREGVAVVLLELEIFEEQIDCAVLLVEFRLGDDRPEDRDFAGLRAQELHDAEGDGALAGMRAGSGDVKSFAHSEFGAAEQMCPDTASHRI